MRPHLLKFSGIGSYPGDVSINFDDLNSIGLYLIVGPTGAGKTTLLDAMTFALFGRVAHGRENSIISAYAHSKPPKIEFEFSQNGRRFLVHREPIPQGKTLPPNKQWIKEIDSSGNEFNQITGASKVSEFVREIVGLTADEFMQVVLLPQGKFEQFLTAKGGEKQKVLQTIFGTTLYRRVVDNIKRSASELRQETQDENVELGKQRAVIDSALDSLQQYTEFEELPDYDDNPATTVEFISNISRSLDEQETVTREAFAQLKIDKSDAETEANRFDYARDLAEKQKFLAKELETFQSLKSAVEKHQRAEPVIATDSIREDIAKQITELNGQIEATRKEVLNSSQKMRINSSVTKIFVDAILTATPTTLAGEFIKLKSTLLQTEEQFEDLDSKKERVSELKTETKQLQDDIATHKTRLSELKKLVETSAAELASARKAVKGLSRAEKQVNELDELIEKADVKAAGDAVSAQMILTEKANVDFAKADKLLTDALAQRTKQLSGVLAEELVPGHPCPVCGSKEHPQKARKTKISAVDITALEKKREKCSRQKINAERDLQDAQSSLEQAQAFKKKLPTATEQKKIRKAFEELNQLNESLDDLEEVHADLVEEQQELTDIAANAEKHFTQSSTELKTLEKEAKRIEDLVSKVGTAVDITASLKISDMISGCLDTLTQSFDEASRLQGQLKQADGALSQALSVSQFAEVLEAQKYILDDETLLNHTRFIDEYHQIENDSEKLVIQIGDEPVPAERPNLELIEEKLKIAEQQNAKIASLAGAVRTSLKQINSSQKKIEKLAPLLEKKLKVLSEAESIAHVFEKGASASQLGLEMWVQRILFEEVCLVANEQLLSLSNNRYLLTLDPEEGGIRKTRASGLDLYILDSQSGTTRPVHTLSGGEKFVSSLALALALAEVVQRHAGGIELPCLFIDEGFGGLDLDSLDTTIEVLGKIQSTGRTIGIITHVEMMQQRLPIGIRVNKSHTGSNLQLLPT